MVFTDFAPNEKYSDWLTALRTLFIPWKWRRGNETTKLKLRLKQKFFAINTSIHFYLTGRCALYTFLKSLQLAEGSEVLIQAFTCAAVILPIHKLGLTTVYVDINSEDYSMNFDDLEKKITSKTKVLILQHTFGITPIYREKILDLARKKNITVLEDIAHGAAPGLFKIKHDRFNLLMSYGRSKFISSVFGGAIVTKYKRIDDNLSRLDKNLKNPSGLFIFRILLYKLFGFIIIKTYLLGIGKLIHQLTKSTGIFIPEVTRKEKRGIFDEFLIKSFPNISAIFLLSQLQTFNDVVKKRTILTQYYNRKLVRKIPELPLIRYPYLVENRSSLIIKARKQGIMLGTWYDQIVGPRGFDMTKTNYKNYSCPVAEKIVEQIINLPTNVTLKQAQQIVELIKNQDGNKNS